MADRISLCLIARDEQELLPGCLESAREAVDEVILVDTGSRDRTPAIARRFEAVVLSFPWNDDFSAARNHGLERATGDWILALDCDERLEGGSAARRAVGQPDQDAFLALMVNVGEDGGRGEQWRALRLFRNSSGVRYRGRVHEQLIRPGQRAPGLVEATILHLGYQASRVENRRKPERNLRLVEMELAGATDPAQRSLYLLYYAFGTRGPQRGERVARWAAFVEANPDLTRPPLRPWIASGLAHYGWTLSDAGRHAEAHERAAALLHLAGESPLLRLLMARARAEAGELSAAEQLLGPVLASAPRLAEIYREFPLDLGLVARRGCFLLAQIRERQGRIEDAERIYRELAESEPGYLAPLLRRVCVLTQGGRFREAMEILESSPLASQGLAELDCLGLALSLILRSERSAEGWRERVRAWAGESLLAARVLDQAAATPPGAAPRLADFPDLEQGVRLGGAA